MDQALSALGEIAAPIARGAGDRGVSVGLQGHVIPLARAVERSLYMTYHDCGAYSNLHSPVSTIRGYLGRQDLCTTHDLIRAPTLPYTT